MLIIINLKKDKPKNKADLQGFIEQYFDDADGDNYARLIGNYPEIINDFIQNRRCDC